jgi:hypothetical protein
LLSRNPGRRILNLTWDLEFLHCPSFMQCISLAAPNNVRANLR